MLPYVIIRLYQFKSLRIYAKFVFCICGFIFTRWYRAVFLFSRSFCSCCILKAEDYLEMSLLSASIKGRSQCYASLHCYEKRRTLITRIKRYTWIEAVQLHLETSNRLFQIMWRLNTKTWIRNILVVCVI